MRPTVTSAFLTKLPLSDRVTKVTQMSLSIADFTTPDPNSPPQKVIVDWPAVEAWLGTELPADYKQLADAYGPLDFGEYIWIHVPCVEGTRFDYGKWLQATHREARIALRSLPADKRLAVHPEPGGLLAWGTTRGTDDLFWDTSSSPDPDAWTVVVHYTSGIPGNGLERWHRYNLTFIEYLRHTVREQWQMPSPPGPLIGPLPGTIARTAYLPTAQPWTPAEATIPRLTDPERRIAMETGSGLSALRLLSPPPSAPFLGEGTWAELFDELGTRLPSEYVTLMDLYGAGCWSNWLRLDAPLRLGEKGFLTHVRSTSDAYLSLQSGNPQWYPMTAWPAPGGFLPFGSSIDGDYLGWLTEGEDPDAWKLIVWPRHADQGPALDHGLIDTLVAWQRGTFSAEGFAGLDEDDDPLDYAGFESWDDDAFDF